MSEQAKTRVPPERAEEAIRMKKYYRSRSMGAMKNIATLSEARKIINENYMEDYRYNEPLRVAINDLEAAFRRAIVAEAEYIRKSDTDFAQDDSGG